MKVEVKRDKTVCNSHHLIYVEGGHTENIELQVKREKKLRKQNQGR